MDLVGACRAFVAVGRHGSFTVGAAVAGIPQPVASRRVAALERHLGVRLLERSTRHVTLTAVGRELIGPADRLVGLADAFEHDVERARRRPFRVALPDVAAPAELARLVAGAARLGIDLDPAPAPPPDRAELVHSHQVRAAVTAVPLDEAVWWVPLGVATARPRPPGPVHLDTLRLGRTARTTRADTVWIQPEDAVPHVRDRLARRSEETGLRPGQVRVAVTLLAATADTLGSDDLLLCSPAQAARLDLHWRPLGGPPLARGHGVVAESAEDAAQLRDTLGSLVATCLGAQPCERPQDTAVLSGPGAQPC